MTTTEPARLRLHLLAFLAVAYVVAWGVFRARTPPDRPPARRVLWLHELPPGERPRVDLPAGWQLTGSAAPVRPAPRRPGRIRTRSS